MGAKKESIDTVTASPDKIEAPQKRQLDLTLWFAFIVGIWIIAMFLIPHVIPEASNHKHERLPESIGQTIFMLLSSVFIGGISLVQFFEQNQWVMLISVVLTAGSVIRFYKNQIWLGCAFWINSGAFIFYCSKRFSVMRFADGMDFYQFVLFLLSSPLSPVVIIGIFTYLAIQMGLAAIIRTFLGIRN